jgi:predicted enzyme related to lactoylglutathione lyase
MKQLISFFEIPASDFNRAITFYESVFGIKLNLCECGDEKMAFFPEPENGPGGAISLASGFNPSADGVLISFSVDSISQILQKVLQSGGRVVIPSTAISAEGMGYFAVFIDSEGNKLGLHSQEG